MLMALSGVNKPALTSRTVLQSNWTLQRNDRFIKFLFSSAACDRDLTKQIEMLYGNVHDLSIGPYVLNFLLCVDI